MAGVISVDFARGDKGMGNPPKPAAASNIREDAQKMKGQNRTVRLGDDAWETWRLWCRVNGMTYEESLVFLIEQHPITAEQLRQTYPLLRREPRR